MLSPKPCPSTRIFIDPQGNRYVAQIVPHEHRGPLGGSPDLAAGVIETDNGRQVGSVGVYRNVRLEDLTERELLKLLVRALEGATR